MIRVQLASTAGFAALLAAYAPPRLERASGVEEGWAEDLRQAQHRAVGADAGTDRTRTALKVVP